MAIELRETIAKAVDWAMADKVAEFVESHVGGMGKRWGATSQGDGTKVYLEAHDGSRMTVEYMENADGSWTLITGFLYLAE